jgi:hypothetical protein
LLSWAVHIIIGMAL